MPRAGIDIDVRIDAALTDQPQLVEAIEKRCANRGPLPYQHQGFGIPQAPGEDVNVLHVIVPDLSLVSGQLREAVESTEGVVIIVENGDLHWRPAVCRVSGIQNVTCLLYTSDAAD